jgi:DNA-directed RNA polymerase subunit RPC12/RpoP
MTVTEMKALLRNGNFFSTARETKVKCTKCGKHFMVDTGVVAYEIVKNKACTCSPCGTRTLIPVHK